MATRELRALAALLGALLSTSARAADARPRQARVVIQACDAGPVSPPELLRLLGLELSASEVQLTQTSSAVDLFLAVAIPDCAPTATRVELAVLATASGEGASAAVRLAPGRTSPARLVAVTAAELVRSALAKREAPPPVARLERVEAWSPTPEWEEALLARARAGWAPPAEPPPAPSRNLTMTLGIDAFPSLASALPALSLEGTVLTSSAARLRLDLGVVARRGRERALRGDVSIGSLAGSLALRVWTRVEQLELEAGPRVAAGGITALGSATVEGVAGGRVTALLVEVWFDLGVRWRISESLSIGARGSAGHLLRGLAAQSDGADVTGVDGPALGFASSMAWSW